MNWRLKVAGFKALSALPGGKALYRLAQKRVTGSLRPTEARVSQKIEVGARYFEWLRTNGCLQQIEGGTHLDFGAGWHPTIPLVCYSAGLRKQILFDLSPLLDQQLVEQTVNIVLSLLQSRYSNTIPIKHLPPPVNGAPWREYLNQLGIEYKAPYNGDWSSLSANVDLVTSTQVLLHIPRQVLAGCFANIFQCLKRGGVFLATIHLRDLVSSIQAGASKYNQLRYSHETWERWINSPLMSYSRLRAADYKELLKAAGFEVAGFEVEHGTTDDFKELDQIPIAPCFQRYSREELAAKHLFFAARKP